MQIKQNKMQMKQNKMQMKQNKIKKKPKKFVLKNVRNFDYNLMIMGLKMEI